MTNEVRPRSRGAAGPELITVDALQDFGPTLDRIMPASTAICARSYLCTQFRCLLENERLVVYDLLPQHA